MFTVVSIWPDTCGIHFRVIHKQHHMIILGLVPSLLCTVLFFEQYSLENEVQKKHFISRLAEQYDVICG